MDGKPNSTSPFWVAKMPPLSTAERFANYFFYQCRKQFYNYTQNAQCLDRTQRLLERISLSACIIDAESSQSGSLYLCSIDHSLPCHSKYQRSIWVVVHCPFYVWIIEVLHKVYRPIWCRLGRIHSWPSVMHTIAKVCINHVVWLRQQPFVFVMDCA